MKKSGAGTTRAGRAVSMSDPSTRSPGRAGGVAAGDLGRTVRNDTGVRCAGGLPGSGTPPPTADLLGVKSGAIQEGKAADLIAVPSNPLEDITALRSVHFVMKDGQVYKSDGHFVWDTPRAMNNPRRKPRRMPRE